MRGCPACKDAKQEIKKREKLGINCYDFECIDVDKQPKEVPDSVDRVPWVEINGKLCSFQDAMTTCRRK